MSDQVTIDVALPEESGAAAALRAYFSDVIGVYHGRPATPDEVGEEMDADPSDGLRPPTGLLLLAHRGEQIVGCAGLWLLPGRSAR